VFAQFSMPYIDLFPQSINSHSQTVTASTDCVTATFTEFTKLWGITYI